MSTNSPAWANAAATAGLKVLAAMKEEVKAAEVKAVDTPAPTLVLITPEQLRKCAPSLSISRSQVMASLLNKLCPLYGIKTKDVLHEFLANLLQESLEFQYRVENLYYQVKTLMSVWPKHFKTAEAAMPYAKNPQKLGNFIYGVKLGKILGNLPGTNDGYDLRGSGFPGLTGRFVLTAFAKYKGLKTPEEAAAYCRNSDYGALEAALWFFCVLKNLIPKADRDDMIGIVKEWNGGTIGLKDRLTYLNRVKKYVV